MTQSKRIAKQPKPKKAVRHHPFERALTWAQNRLAKAEALRKKRYEEVVALDKEIPKLREIIRVHSETFQAPAKSTVGKIAPPAYTPEQMEEVTKAVARATPPRDRELLPDIPMPHVPPSPEDDPLEVAEQLLKSLTKK